MSTPSQFGSPPKPSSGGTSILKIVLIILLLMALGCAGTCAGCVWLAKQGADAAGKVAQEEMQQRQLSAAYDTTEGAVRGDSQVTERLGTPLEVTPPKRQGEGPLKPEGETFQFDVTGPKGTAIVSAVAVGTGGTFTVTTISVKLSDGTTLDVKPPTDQLDPYDLKIDGGGDPK